MSLNSFRAEKIASQLQEGSTKSKIESQISGVRFELLSLFEVYSSQQLLTSFITLNFTTFATSSDSPKPQITSKIHHKILLPSQLKHNLKSIVNRVCCFILWLILCYRTAENISQEALEAADVYEIQSILPTASNSFLIFSGCKQLSIYGITIKNMSGKQHLLKWVKTFFDNLIGKLE